MHTNHWALLFLSSFLHVFSDLLQTLFFTHLIGHPQCALKASQPRDGHVKAHGVHEAYLRTLEKKTLFCIEYICATHVTCTTTFVKLTNYKCPKI